MIKKTILLTLTAFALSSFTTPAHAFFRAPYPPPSKTDKKEPSKPKKTSKPKSAKSKSNSTASKRK